VYSFSRKLEQNLLLLYRTGCCGNDCIEMDGWQTELGPTWLSSTAEYCLVVCRCLDSWSLNRLKVRWHRS